MDAKADNSRSFCAGWVRVLITRADLGSSAWSGPDPGRFGSISSWTEVRLPRCRGCCLTPPSSSPSSSSHARARALARHPARRSMDLQPPQWTERTDRRDARDLPRTARAAPPSDHTRARALTQTSVNGDTTHDFLKELVKNDTHCIFRFKNTLGIVFHILATQRRLCYSHIKTTGMTNEIHNSTPNKKTFEHFFIKLPIPNSFLNKNKSRLILV